ncbi:phosphoenolpyruvate--protein phosphotransferase [Candidatus Leptofilum sp.]|uniref:phosphoenolpyruvate--protein phosphotransferase n=1 Tax=Candidatus Leptofilum sp. TaxID=3241576 RepID=UPI003B5B9816
MKQLNFVIENATGLHARPAKVFVKTAKKFKSNIRISHGEKNVNAKSLIAVLGLGVKHGGQIQVDLDGEDEELAAEAIQTAVHAGLGEGDAAHKPEPKPAPVKPAPANGDVVQAISGNGLAGIGAAPGLAIGPVFQFRETAVTITHDFSGVAAEQDRLHTALALGQEQLATLQQEVATHAPEEAAIFEVHRELLTDDDLLDAVQAKIEAEQNAAQAWQTTTEERASQLAALDDPLLAARAADIRDVGNRILKILAGESDHGIVWPDHPVVVFAHDLTPSDTATLDPKKVLGFATAVGGPTAHSAIIARALNLPAVVSVGDSLLEVADGTAVILDGSTGVIQVNPDNATQQEAKSQLAAAIKQQQAAREQANEPAITLDNHRIEIAANIGGVADAIKANRSGAEGVGLLRTEFLFLDRATPPSEEEQFDVYKQIAEAMEGKPVIIRTLDIGGDKPLPYVQVPPEENPFLGERGIRLCLNRPELLREQLRAILRAASFGSLRIMFPMVADLTEWYAAKAIVDEIQAELNAPEVPVGIMIEIPAAALMADLFAKEVDFFSIGTNDLTQYTLAMDRMHPVLAGKSDGLHPSVLRLIDATVRGAHAAGKWVGVCGELGADPQATQILLGLGVDELSVSVPSIAMVKAKVRGLSHAEAQKLAVQALACSTAQEVRNLVG